MFKVSRKSEYALMAIQHMARLAPDAVVSVADLAAQEDIPADLLAKVLQGLKRAGLLIASKGAGGGYRLARPAGEIRFLEVVRPFEEQIAVVSCHSPVTDCQRTDACSLRDPMSVLNAYLMRQFEQMTMELFVSPHTWLTTGPRTTTPAEATSLGRRA
ncbi:MAG: Rrf2 family transcriptional regulator [Deltaproteobacteria bacterium]|nr:Rrf2 family transcriptional regulator [Deltaproteobacteria bacterium]